MARIDQPGQDGGQRNPLELLALDPAGVAEADHQRRGAGQDGQDGHEQGELVGDPQGAAVDLRVHRAGDELEERVQRPRRRWWPPAAVTATTTAETRAHRRQRGEGGDPVGVSSRTNPTAASTAAIVSRVDPGDEVGGGQRPGADDQPVDDVADDTPRDGHDQSLRQQQPAHGVPGPAAGQHRPDGAGRQRRHRRRDPNGARGQVGPAGVTGQVVEPREGGEQEQHQRDSAQASTAGHGRGRRRGRGRAAAPSRATRPSRAASCVAGTPPPIPPPASLGRGQYRGPP